MNDNPPLRLYLHVSGYFLINNFFNIYIQYFVSIYPYFFENPFQSETFKISRYIDTCGLVKTHYFDNGCITFLHECKYHNSHVKQTISVNVLCWVFSAQVWTLIF